MIQGGDNGDCMERDGNYTVGLKQHFFSFQFHIDIKWCIVP